MIKKVTERTLTDKQIEAAWCNLTDICVEENENGELVYVKAFDLPYNIHFDAGTTQNEVWQFFDTHHSKGVYYLLYEYEGDIAIDYDVEGSSYFYALYKRDINGEFTERYTDAAGDFVCFDTVLDAIWYANSVEINVYNSKEDIEAFLMQDMRNLGDTLMGITELAIDTLISAELTDKSVEEINIVYRNVINKMVNDAEINRGIIEEEIADIWRGRPDYEEQSQTYFELSLSNAKQLIRHYIEDSHGYDIAFAYLNEYGKNEGVKYEVFEDNYEYDMGVTIVLYDITPEEYEQLGEKAIVSNINETHFSIDTENLHDEIPDTFFERMYNI